jgi:HD-GYP domain-containing protein (c-di-GMP phosphodiesterase class II)
MKLVTVEDLKDGDVLANDVLLEDYTVVIAKGTVIKKQYIDKLRELEIYTVYIEDEEQEKKKEPEKKKTKKDEAKKGEAKKNEDKKDEAPKETKPKSKAKSRTAKSAPRIKPEEITILREDVKEQMQTKMKSLLDLHMRQHTKGLEKIADEAKTIITDILSEDSVAEKVYDVKERGADIYDHSIQVCTIATLIAIKMGMSEEEINDISVASLLHDLGLRYLVVKYENQDMHLLPAKEQEEFFKHTVYGYTAIKNETWLSENAKEIVLHHHERKDGSGFPLKTKKVSKATQIVGVCDEFDELICGIGKAKVRVNEAINTIRNYSGIWFDSDVVDMFLQLIAVYPAGSKVKTNKGEMGIVMKQNLHFPERPVIKIVEDKYGQHLHEEVLIDLIKDTTVVIEDLVN